MPPRPRTTVPAATTTTTTAATVATPSRPRQFWGNHKGTIVSVIVLVILLVATYVAFRPGSKARALAANVGEKAKEFVTIPPTNDAEIKALKAEIEKLKEGQKAEVTEKSVTTITTTSKDEASKEEKVETAENDKEESADEAEKSESESEPAVVAKNDHATKRDAFMASLKEERQTYAEDQKALDAAAELAYFKETHTGFSGEVKYLDRKPVSFRGTGQDLDGIAFWMPAPAWPVAYPCNPADLEERVSKGLLPGFMTKYLDREVQPGDHPFTLTGQMADVYKWVECPEALLPDLKVTFETEEARLLQSHGTKRKGKLFAIARTDGAKITQEELSALTQRKVMVSKNGVDPRSNLVKAGAPVDPAQSAGTQQEQAPPRAQSVQPQSRPSGPPAATQRNPYRP